MPTMYPLPHTRASTPRIAVGSSHQLIKLGFSKMAFAVTAEEPRIVPRMVWGLRNFQKALIALESLSPSSLLPVDTEEACKEHK